MQLSLFNYLCKHIIAAGNQSHVYNYILYNYYLEFHLRKTFKNRNI